MIPKIASTILVLMTGVLSITAQDNLRLIVQLDSEAEMTAGIKKVNSKSDTEFTWSPVKCISKKLKVWLVNAKMIRPGVDKNADSLMINALQKQKDIKRVQFDYPVTLRAGPNDRLYPKQWQYENNGSAQTIKDADIDAPEAWKITSGGETTAGDEIVVAIVDGGIDLQHPDLIGNIWNNHHEIPDNQIDDDGNGYVDDSFGWNFKQNTSSVDNDGTGHWHGTPVAGIVGAEGNNSIGVSGVNWNIKLMNLVANSTAADIISAYDYILEMRSRYNDSNGKEGAFVVAINTSLGIPRGRPEEAPIWCAMFDALGEAGIISVAATANKNTDVDVEGDLPTTCPSDFLISVTSTDSSDYRDELTAFGLNNIDLGAPGVRTFTAANESKYDYFGGTSSATPHVTGAVGLIYSAKVSEFMAEVKDRPANSALLVKRFILDGTDPLSSLEGKCSTGGRLNLHTSLRALYDHFGSEPLVENNETGIRPIGLSPNPAKGLVNLNFMVDAKVNDVRVNLFDVGGRKIKTLKLGGLTIGIHRVEVPLSTISEGLYFVRINESAAIKLLIN